MKLGKPRKGSDKGRRCSLPELHGLHEEGAALRVGLAELDQVRQLLEAADGFRLQVDALLHARDEAPAEALAALLRELEGLPVHLEAEQLLAAEMRARDWTAEVRCPGLVSRYSWPHF